MEGTDLISWMAWTWPTACFFGFILLCLIGMSAWEKAVPGGGARHGILGLDTTRGDRLFISLLGSAFIFLAWIGLVNTTLYAPLVIAVVYAGVVFRWV
jgi:predicted small integral membrane protein